MANALVWLRRDLRLHDNPALAQAMADGFAPVLVYVHATPIQGVKGRRVLFFMHLKADGASTSSEGSYS